MKNKHLVSIVVASYNSSKTIIDTLDSIATQTYNNIELIISDDCSTDNTIDLCIDWKAKNPKVKTQIVLTPNNIGISGNLNCGIKVSNGEWVKIIAADDMLMPNAIEEYILFCTQNNYSICVCNLLLFGNNSENIKLAKPSYERWNRILKSSLEKKRKRILYELFIPGPGIFFTKNIYNLVGGFDEKYPFGEEWPFFLRVLESGSDIVLLEKELVKYRLNDNSLSRDDNKLNKRVFDNIWDYFICERKQKLQKNGMYITIWRQFIQYTIYRRKYNNNQTTIYRVTTIILKILNPFSYIDYIKRKFKSLNNRLFSRNTKSNIYNI